MGQPRLAGATSSKHFICPVLTSQYNISILKIEQAARRPKAPSMLAAFIKVIIIAIYNKSKK